MATAQDIISELESLLQGLGFTVVEVDQDRNYGPMKASVEIPTTEYTLANLRGDKHAVGSVEVVLVLADRRKGLLRRILGAKSEFAAQDSVIVLGKPASADYLLIGSTLQDFTDAGRRRITATFEVGWTQER